MRVEILTLCSFFRDDIPNFYNEVIGLKTLSKPSLVSEMFLGRHKLLKPIWGIWSILIFSATACFTFSQEVCSLLPLSSFTGVMSHWRANSFCYIRMWWYISWHKSWCFLSLRLLFLYMLEMICFYFPSDLPKLLQCHLMQPWPLT